MPTFLNFRKLCVRMSRQDIEVKLSTTRRSHPGRPGQLWTLFHRHLQPGGQDRLFCQLPSQQKSGSHAREASAFSIDPFGRSHN